MAVIPTQRETVSRAPSHEPGMPTRRGVDRRAVAHATLGGGPLAPGAARGLVRAALAEWARLGLPGAESLPQRLIDDAMVVVSELVTNAVVHAGTDVELACRLETSGEPDAGLKQEGAEVGQGQGTSCSLSRCPITIPPASPRDSGAEPPRHTGVRARPPSRRRPLRGLGRHLPHRRQDRLGAAPRRGATADDDIEAYAGAQAPGRGLPVGEVLAPEPQRAPHDGSGSITAPSPSSPRPRTCSPDSSTRTTSPRSPDSSSYRASPTGARCGWRTSPGGEGGGAEEWEGGRTGAAGTPGPGHGSPGSGTAARTASRSCAAPSRRTRRARPTLPDRAGPGALARRAGPGGGPGRGARCHGRRARLPAGRRRPATRHAGHRAGRSARFPDEVTGLVEDLSRRVALAVGAARQYARQATISRVLQRGLLPGAVAEIPGVSSALVYEPREQGGPAATSTTCSRRATAAGASRRRRPGQGPGGGRRDRPRPALAAAAGPRGLRRRRRPRPPQPAAPRRCDGGRRRRGPRPRRGARRTGRRPADPLPLPPLRRTGAPSTAACAAPSPPPDIRCRCCWARTARSLTAAHRRRCSGSSRTRRTPATAFELRPGDSLLCVTDGVTERRSAPASSTTSDGLADALAGCAGLDAELIAERIRRLVHEFGDRAAGGRPGAAGPPGGSRAVRGVSRGRPGRQDSRMGRGVPACWTMGACLPHFPTANPSPPTARCPRPRSPGPPTAPSGSTCTCPYCATRCGYCDFNTYTATELAARRCPRLPRQLRRHR